MEFELPTAKHRRSILESTARTNILHGSVRSGKTVAADVRWLDYVNTAPAGDLLMVGKTERTLHRNILQPLVEMIGSDSARFTLGAGEGYLLGRKIYLCGANDERAEGKIRGMTLAGAYGDEITLWPESFFKMLLTRLSVKGSKGFYTTNPDGPCHYIKRDYLDREAELDLRAFHFQLRDNPTLEPAFIEALEREYSGLWRRRFIDGEWCLAEGAIWDMFDEDIHVLDEVPAGVDLVQHWVFCDYGTSNPFVALLCGRGSDGRYYVLDEWRWDSREEHRQKTDAQYSQEVREWLAKAGFLNLRWYVDPSAASFLLQLEQDGVSAEPAENDVSLGLGTVGSALGNGDLLILRRCQGLTKEIVSYVWDLKAQERGEDKPVKRNDHGPDALRYGMSMLYLRPPGVGIAGEERQLHRGRLSPFAGRRRIG